MRLPILKKPEYLSPSSFKEWRLCPTKFYFKRMATADYIVEPQSLPAAVGSAFDDLICRRIAQEMGWNEVIEQEDNVSEEHKAKAYPYARRLLNTYIELGCFRNLMDDGILEIHPHTKKIVSYNGKEVPLYGKPDIILASGIPCEFKVSGAFSNSGVSPNPGYLRYINNKCKRKGYHERALEKLETLNEDWALQLAIYHWLDNGITPMRELRVAVEQLAIRGDTIACVSFRNSISIEYQEKLYKSIEKSWDNIVNGDIPAANPEHVRCHAFNSVCFYANQCDAYQGVFNSEEAKLLKPN